MNPEQLLERLRSGEISRMEFEKFLDSLDDEAVVARYEVYLQEEFEREVSDHFSAIDPKSAPKLRVLKNRPRERFNITINKRTKRFSVAAAIVLLAATLLSGWFILSQFDKTNRYLQKRAQISQKPQIITKATPRGRMFRMKMTDGSLVHLNAQSSISYPAEFDSSQREVILKGEAYFDVARDESRPFIIKVGDYKVDVLGTSFNIEAYDDEFAVTVESGIVRVSLDKTGMNAVTLTKNQKLIYNPDQDKAEIIKVDAELELSWRDGILRFDKTPIRKVEKMIERWYGVDIVIADEGIYNKTLTGTHQNKSLKSVLEALTYATKSVYEINEQSIIIKTKNMKKP